MTNANESSGPVAATPWSALKTDVKKEADGVWAKYPGTNAEFLIARAGSDEYERDVRTAQREAGSRGITSPTSQQQREIMSGPMSRHLLRNWRGVAGSSFSQEEAQRRLADPSLKDWCDWVAAVSANPERYRLEDEAGN